MNLTMSMPKNVCVAKKLLPIESESVEPIGGILHIEGEAEMEGALALFESSKGREKQQLLYMVVEGKDDAGRDRTTYKVEEPIPLKSFHNSAC